jgi:hypothetical protein
MGSDDILFDKSLFSIFSKDIEATDSEAHKDYQREMFGPYRYGGCFCYVTSKTENGEGSTTTMIVIPVLIGQQ